MALKPFASIHLLILALLAAMPVVATAGEQDMVRTGKGHVGTRVALAGHGEFLFVVDTAASISAVYEHARTALKLKAEPASRMELHGAGGVQTVERYRLPALNLAGMRTGDLIVAGLPAGVKHGDDIMGIVGQDVLGQHVVEFDFKRNRLGLHARGHEVQSRSGWREVPIRLLPHVGFVTLDARLDGMPVTAVLDTGARRSFINWSAARAAGVTPQTRGLTQVAGGGGATAHRFGFATHGFGRVSVGATSFADARLSIADLPVFATLGFRHRPVMILGIDLLGDKRFVIDYARRRLLIER